MSHNQPHHTNLSTTCFDFVSGICLTMPWSTRMRIALDAAKGLAFLHGATRPIIYRDFKTSNILLDSVCSSPCISSSICVIALLLYITFMDLVLYHKWFKLGEFFSWCLYKWAFPSNWLSEACPWYLVYTKSILDKHYKFVVWNHSRGLP